MINYIYGIACFSVTLYKKNLYDTLSENIRLCYITNIFQVKHHADFSRCGSRVYNIRLRAPHPKHRSLLG